MGIDRRLFRIPVLVAAMGYLVEAHRSLRRYFWHRPDFTLLLEETFFKDMGTVEEE